MQTNQPLKVLEGRHLSSVEFVQDYVQLRFDGPTLSAITQPSVRVASHLIKWGEGGYRDALCERIGKMVSAASTVPGQEITVDFEDGSVISISLKPSDYRATEAAMLDNPPNPIVVW